MAVLHVTMASVAAIFAAVSGEPPAAVDRERLMATLRELPTDRAALGGPGGVEGLQRTSALIVDRLTTLGYEPRLEAVRWTLPARRWPDPGDAKDGAGDVHRHRTPPRPFHNVIADLPGREAPGEVLLIGAHYDAAPRAPGADDNGTGVAALLELARVLKDRPMRRTVRLAFFTLEEVGLVGSREHAAAYRATKPSEPASPEPAPGRLIGMVSLEMLGYYTDEPGSQRSPIKPVEGVFVPPTVGNFLAAVTLSQHAAFCRRLASEMEKASPLPVFCFDVFPVPVPDMLRSDHAPFLALGVPAVMLTDTANFRNPNYHRPTDTVETIDAERFTQAVRALAGAIEAIAEPAAVGADAKRTTPGGEDPGR